MEGGTGLDLYFSKIKMMSVLIIARGVQGQRRPKGKLGGCSCCPSVLTKTVAVGIERRRFKKRSICFCDLSPYQFSLITIVQITFLLI